MGRDTWLVLAYALAGMFVVLSGFTRGFIDEPNMLMDLHLIAAGRVPYVDFFEHHPLTHIFLLTPLARFLGNGVALVIALHLLAIAAVFAGAWLVFRIARREKLAQPHLASLLFLVGYTGLPTTFLRDEFFSMFFLLLFFAFTLPFVRGILAALLGGMSPMMVLPAGALLTASLFNHRRERKKFMQIIAGAFVGGFLWVFLHRHVLWSEWYSHVIKLNSALAGSYHRLPFIEVLFFSLIFTVPLVVFGALYAWRKAKSGNNTAALALVFGATFISQLIILNIVNGPWLRLKLPGTLTLLGLSTIFFADARQKFGIFCIALQLALTLFVFTPALDFPRTEFFSVESKLDECVADVAEIRPLIDDRRGRSYAVLLRSLKEHWWGGYYAPPLGPDASAGTLRKGEIDLCMNAVSIEDIICDSDEIRALQLRCDSLREYPSAFNRVKKFLR